MANLRRTKLKARRIGVDIKKIDKCKTKEEVEKAAQEFVRKLVSELNKKREAESDELSE